MLTLLVPGVGMGGSGSGTSVSLAGRLLLLGVGRAWWVPLLGLYH